MAKKTAAKLLDDALKALSNEACQKCTEHLEEAGVVVEKDFAQTIEDSVYNSLVVRAE